MHLILGTKAFCTRMCVGSLLFMLCSAGSVLQAQPVEYAWRIVLVNFINQTKAVLPEQYPDQSSCEIAMNAMGYNDINVTGLHGKCRMLPVTWRPMLRPKK